MEQPLELADEPPVVPFAQLVGLAADPVLGEPRGVVGPAQRTVADRFQFPDLVEVVLPDLGGVLVHDDRAGAVVLVEHRQHRTDVGIGVHHDARASAPRQPHLLVDAVATAREDDDGPRPTGRTAKPLPDLPPVPDPLPLPDPLDPRDVVAEREPCGVLQRVVVREGPDAVQQVGEPGPVSTPARLVELVGPV